MNTIVYYLHHVNVCEAVRSSVFGSTDAKYVQEDMTVHTDAKGAWAHRYIYTGRARGGREGGGREVEVTDRVITSSSITPGPPTPITTCPAGIHKRDQT